MAGEYLRSHGIDIDAEMSRIQSESLQGTLRSEKDPMERRDHQSVPGYRNVCLPHTALNSRWDVSVEGVRIAEIQQHDADSTAPSKTEHVDGKGALLAPSLCHPHVHIDKAYLLSHPKYAHLQMDKGDFEEAMSLTGEAKGSFEEFDLLERGQRVIDESVAAGVTHMRAFVEVDAIVGSKCLDVGIKLKGKAQDANKCFLQLCAFAQLPLFTPSKQDEDGAIIRRLMQDSGARNSVAVVGSTPYVEKDRAKMRQNVEWMVALAIEQHSNLDFHLDYNLDADEEPMVWYVIETLKDQRWKERNASKTVVLGHCTRLTLFNAEQWKRLQEEIGDLPVSFVGLPNSDMFSKYRNM